MKFTTNDIRIEGSVEGGVKVSFFSLDATYNHTLLHKYSGKNYTVEIKEHKGKRSLDANAYCWVLCGKISSHKDIYMSKDAVYQKAIKDYGVTAIMPINDDQLNDIVRWHDKNGLGNAHRIIGPCKNFEGYTNVCFYYGSSGYDTKQMSRFIDGIVADAKDLGIETMTPAELERLKGEWI